MKKFAPGLWPTVMTVPIVAVLVVLSVWQLNRYSWKVELVAHLSEQMAREAVALPKEVTDITQWEHRPVKLKGTFLNAKEIHLFSHADKGRKGFQIITPFVREDTGKMLLVNRGWVPEGKKDAANRKEGLLSGTVEVTGVIRKPWTKSYDFLPANNGEENVWLYGDLQEMADFNKITVAPFFVELDAAPVPGGWPLGGQTRVTIPNNHLEYFITWFGLAMALLVIYVLYGVKRANKRD